MPQPDEKQYLEEVLQHKFNSELCDKYEASQIISILKSNGINTTRFELDYAIKYDSSFELIK